MITSNHIPSVRGDDVGIWRRLRQVQWPVQIPPAERDGNLRERLVAREGPGILRWMFEGFSRWHTEGSLAEPPAVAEATSRYRGEQDHFGDFLEERCMIGDPVQVGATKLRTVYEAWCGLGGLRALDTKAVAERLRRRDCSDVKIKGRKVWRGIAIREEEAERPR